MDFREQLDSMLLESIEDCRVRESSTFARAIEGKRDLVLFGAGGLGRKILSALRSEGVEPLAFIDNKIAGKEVDGLKVLLPAEAAERWGTSAAFVVTIWASWADTMHAQVESLRALGCQTVVSFIPVLWKFPNLLPHVQIELPSRVLEQKERI